MEVDGEAPQPPAFDLETYIANYMSHAKIDRLVFIADQSRGKPLELEALRLAVDDLKKGENTQRYLELVGRINGRLGPSYTVDRQHVDSTDRRAALRLEKLEAELNSAKSNMIKESIRQGHNDLGDFYMERGDYQNAFKSYARSRDYCTSAKHIHAMCLNVIRVSIQMANWVSVHNYVAKAEQVPELDQADPLLASKLQAASGLAYLDSKKYKNAARCFVKVSPDLGAAFSEVAAMQDVALYGALTGLASFDRAELKTHLVSNIAFREFLDLLPEVREVVSDFFASRYGSCLQRLEALQPALALDRHLQRHLPQLLQAIRQKAICLYTSPYTSLSLASMATAFHTPLPELEAEVAALVMEGRITARIDSHSHVLYAQRSDIRAATFHKVLAAAEEYVRESKALLLRASLLQHDVIQKPPRGGQPTRGGGPGPSGGGFMAHDRAGPSNLASTLAALQHHLNA